MRGVVGVELISVACYLLVALSIALVVLCYVGLCLFVCLEVRRGVMSVWLECLACGPSCVPHRRH